MRITNVSQPLKGPRGGLAGIGSITLKNEEGEVVWVQVNSPRGWSDGQQKMFDGVVSALAAWYGDIDGPHNQG